MKSIFHSLWLTVLFISCKKQHLDLPVFSEAQYQVTITGKWSSPDFTVPAGVHFTNFIGMVHNSNSYLWRVGIMASPGIERVAETGDGTTLLAEIDSLIAAGNASAWTIIFAPAPTGNSMRNIYCNSNFSFVSFASMLAPSPDWFVGISGIDLYAGNKWITDTTINLYAHDAGTEEGDVFGYNNPATTPRQNIHLLSASGATVLANGNAVLAPIASARFTRR